MVQWFWSKMFDTTCGLSWSSCKMSWSCSPRGTVNGRLLFDIPADVFLRYNSDTFRRPGPCVSLCCICSNFYEQLKICISSSCPHKCSSAVKVGRARWSVFSTDNFGNMINRVTWNNWRLPTSFLGSANAEFWDHVRSLHKSHYLKFWVLGNSLLGRTSVADIFQEKLVNWTSSHSAHLPVLICLPDLDFSPTQSSVLGELLKISPKLEPSLLTSSINQRFNSLYSLKIWLQC